MNDDTSWDKIVDAIDAKFGITKHGRYSEPLPDKIELTQKVAFICFTKDGQQYKLERLTRPAVVDRKSHYNKSSAGNVRHENIYDPDTTSHKTNFYRQDEAGEWQELDPSQFSL